MKNYKHLAFEGRLGLAPEMRYMPNGKAVTSFSVAVNDDYQNDSGELIKQLVWFRVSAFGKLAEICNQYLTKGAAVIVEGWLKPDPATGSPKVYDKQDGSKGSSYEVTANTVRFLSGKDGDHSEHASQGNDFAGTPEEDIPF